MNSLPRVEMNRINYKRYLFLYALLVVLSVSACTSLHTIIFQDADNAEKKVELNIALANALQHFLDEGSKLPLDRVLDHIGYKVVDQVSIIQAGQAKQDFKWAEIAEQAYWHKDGSISINGSNYSPETILVQSNPLVEQVQFKTTDMANTILSALSLPLIESGQSASLTDLKAKHVIFVFWDGLGYLDLIKALGFQIVPTMVSLPEPQMGLSVYPSITSVATAAMITGLSPDKNGVMISGVRSTEAMTIFERIDEGNKEYTTIEGNTLYFSNLNSDQLVLNADVDGNGSTDDEVYMSALQEIKQGLPDFLWVHFHGLDDSGHTYAPWSEEYIESLQLIDGFIGNLINASPEDTLFIISADHGMHTSTSGVRSGEHGTLMAQDMLIPLIIYQKSSASELKK